MNGGFLDELLKIAVEYRKIRGNRDLLREDIPYMSLPKNLSVDERLHRISEGIDKSDGSLLGHKNLAVPTKQLKSMGSLGFKPTRLAVPLPGERGIAPVTYRRGVMHAHKMGDYTLFHKDDIAPSGMKALSHFAREGIPAIRKRFKKEFRDPPVMER